MNDILSDYLKRFLDSVKQQTGIVALFVSLITLILTIMSLFVLLNI